MPIYNDNRLLLGKAEYRAFIDRVLADSPRDARPYLAARFSMALRRRDYDAARETLEHWHRSVSWTKQDKLRGVLMETRLEEVQGHLRAALSHLEEATKFAPENPEVRWRRARLFAQTDQSRWALRELRLLLKMDPEHHQGRVLLQQLQGESER